MVKVLKLTEMKTGQRAKVSTISGGSGLQKKLEGMGIRPGRSVQKISQHHGSGPVIIKIGNTQVALGRGMAMKIEVESL